MLSAASGVVRHDDSRASFEFVILLTKEVIGGSWRCRSSDQKYVCGFNVCVAPLLVEPSVRDFGVSE